MIIKKTSLAYRWYQEWVARGGTPPPVMNLCHFVRVLMIWGPIRWFLCQREKVKSFGGVEGFLQLLLLTGAGILLALIWLHPWTFFVVVLGAGLGFGALILLNVGMGGASFRLYRDYRAAKTSKICPIIEVEK